MTDDGLVVAVMLSNESVRLAEINPHHFHPHRAGIPSIVVMADFAVDGAAVHALAAHSALICFAAPWHVAATLAAGIGLDAGCIAPTEADALCIANVACAFGHVRGLSSQSAFSFARDVIRRRLPARVGPSLTIIQEVRKTFGHPRQHVSEQAAPKLPNLKDFDGGSHWIGHSGERKRRCEVVGNAGAAIPDVSPNFFRDDSMNAPHAVQKPNL